MKYNKPVKKIQNEKYYLWLSIPLLSLAFYVMHILSGFFSAEGRINIIYTSDYPLALFAEYITVTLPFIPFIMSKKDEDKKLSFFLLPLMSTAAAGMTRIESSVPVTSAEADFSPFIMFLIFFVSIVVMAFSGHTLTGTAGILTGTVIYPAFGIAFAPFIAAASFLFADKKNEEKKISLLLNSIFCIVGIIYGIVKLTPAEFSFSKKYIPVFFMAAVLIIFFVLKKEYTFIPLALLPLFPLATGIFFDAFPTPLFTLSASVAPLVILLLTAALTDSNEKIKGYAQTLVHNPAMYIIIAVFILHTAFPIFVSPGYFRDVYI